MTRGFWKNEEPNGKNDRPQELDCDRDSVRPGVITILRSVDHAIGYQDTDGNTELITSHESAANLFGSDFLKTSINIWLAVFVQECSNICLPTCRG